MVATGFVVYAVAVASLVREARRRPAEADRPAPAERRVALVPPVATNLGFAVLSGLVVISAIALLPPAVDLSTDSSAAHHLAHSAQFLLGGLVTLGLGSRRVLERPIPAGAPWWAWVVVVAAPALMLLAMTPAIYGPLEDHSLLHLLYHWGIVGLGLATGWAAVRFGQVSGTAIFTLSVLMGAVFAGGVGG